MHKSMVTTSWQLKSRIQGFIPWKFFSLITLVTLYYLYVFSLELISRVLPQYTQTVKTSTNIHSLPDLCSTWSFLKSSGQQIDSTFIKDQAAWSTPPPCLPVSHIFPPPECPKRQCPPRQCFLPPKPPSPYDPTKVVFLAETRSLSHLPALFAHMTSIISPEWTFKFMGSSDSISFMRSSPLISRLEVSGKLAILDLPSNYSLSDRETISQMFTDITFYRDLLSPAEHLLVFQPDSIFCANAPHTINDFLEWDWIGAPWSKDATWGGNGGLSLRKVSKILKVLESEKREVGDSGLEDWWLSSRINALEGSKMPHADVSKTFSVESVWDDSPLGYHIGWLGVHHEQIWDDQAQVDHIMNYCPEVKMILGMKLDSDKPDGIER